MNGVWIVEARMRNNAGGMTWAVVSIHHEKGPAEAMARLAAKEHGRARFSRFTRNTKTVEVHCE